MYNSSSEVFSTGIISVCSNMHIWIQHVLIQNADADTFSLNNLL